MNEIELIVGLKIPDTTAITAFHTLEKLGYNRLIKLKREDLFFLIFFIRCFFF